MKIYEYPRVDLTRDGECYEIPTRLDWRMLLMIAHIGGWQPADRGDYERTYLQVGGQEVSADEACAIAEAVISVLDDIPDFDIPVGTRIIPFEFFSGGRKRELINFADFCYGGGFEVR